MGTFNTKTILHGDPALIPLIASRIEESFEAEDYKVETQNLMSGSADISIAKGGIFKTVLGMKTALKINLQPQGGEISFSASVGLFGQQIIPALIAWFYAWPIIITQIWGLVKQSQLDDKALAIAEAVVKENTPEPKVSAASVPGKRFCTRCGRPVPEGASFCPSCGTKLQ